MQQARTRHEEIQLPQFSREHKTFNRPEAALGAAHSPGAWGGAHLIHMMTLAAPLIIGELVQDSQKRWRYTRIVSLVGAIVTEGLWQHKVRSKSHREDARER